MSLYPPSIPDIIEAGVDSINIKIINNDLVRTEEYTGYSVKIKSIQSGQVILTKDIEGISKDIIDITFDQDSPVVSGQFYKAQVAYYKINNKDDGTVESKEIGSYSNVGIFKRTSEPTLALSNSNLQFFGSYVNENDPTEKEYYYTFSLQDKNSNLIIATSGQQIHSADSVWDIYEFKNIPNGVYKCIYEVITNNLLTVSTESEIKIQRNESPATADSKLSFSYHYDDGYAIIKNTDSSNPFGLWKKKNNDNWYYIDKIESNQSYLDFDYEQGEAYKIGYSLDEGKNIYYFEKTVDFEDMFLFDKNRQLAIRYNPQVNSISRITQESKMETIGSKFPFFFHSTDIDYKEFQLSGLIAISMDENELFSNKYIDKDTSMRTSTYSKENLKPWDEGKSIADERKFKLEVLEWLGNGEPKVLKTPYEGNYIVHLSSVSLAPESGLGRKLHNFTCTADEMAEYTTENLIELNLI